MPKYKHLGQVSKLLMGATAGATAIGGTEVKGISECTISYSRESVDVSDRASGEWGSSLASTKSCELTFTYFDQNTSDHADETLNKLLDAWHSGDLLSLAPLSEGGYGIDADFAVISVEDGQNVGEAAAYNFTLQVNTDLRTPSQVKAGAVVTGTPSNP